MAPKIRPKPSTIRTRERASKAATSYAQAQTQLLALEKDYEERKRDLQAQIDSARSTLLGTMGHKGVPRCFTQEGYVFVLVPDATEPDAEVYTLDVHPQTEIEIPEP